MTISVQVNAPASNGLYIPAWDGNPDVGTLTDREQLDEYSGQTFFSSGTHTIEDKKIVDTLDMPSGGTASLTLRNCWVNGNSNPNWGIIQDGSGASLLLEDCYLSDPSGSPASWISVTGVNVTMRRCKFDPGMDGVRFSSNSLMEQCHILGPNNSVSYGDAIQITGGDDMTVSYCYLKNTMQTAQPGAGNAVIISKADQGTISSLRIEHTVLEGGAQGTLQINEAAFGCQTDLQLNDVIMDTTGTLINIGSCDNGSTVSEWVNVRELDETPIANPDP